MEEKSYSKFLRIFLWLIGIHSVVVGILLVFLSTKSIEYFGVSNADSFFRIQAGVFHIAISVAYFMAAIHPAKNKKLLIFIITVKFIATFYLLIYYFAIEQIWIIGLSAIADFLMGLIVLLLYLKLTSCKK